METISALNIAGLPKIFFGAGKFCDLHQIIPSYGNYALIFIGGESLKKSGRWNALSLQLNRTRFKYKAVSVWGEPTTEAIDAMASEFRKTPVNVVAAIGGGSVIDCGKAVAAMLASDGSVKDYLEGVGTRKPSGTKVPFIAVPTTAGTGSEATKNAVICDRKDGYKKSLRHDAYMPDATLVDPELTLTLPRHITISCGLDAVSQLIEAYTSTKADTSLDSLVLKALYGASESLPPLALGQSNDILLRGKMSYAALVSGIALSRSGLGAVHGIAGAMGGIIPVPHGVACGKLLFPVITFVIKKIVDEKNIVAQKRFADIGKILTGNADGDDIFYCKQFLGVLDKWTRTLKLPQLSRFGMTAAYMEKIISIANSKNSPAILSKEEMKVILEVVR
ncbi:MAG TPA: alcohol dehydrogenase [Smithella sp.]|jgi:alcohol dehydrogenase class IV|nr:alcohol dehydrogenase [Smithella sp.]